MHFIKIITSCDFIIFLYINKNFQVNDMIVYTLL